MDYDPRNKSKNDVDDETLRRALGKIDQYRLLESLYRKNQEEMNMLKEELNMLKKRANKEEAGSVDKSSKSQMRRSLSITQQLLHEVDIKNLEYPTEFFRTLEKEKQEEIQILKKRTNDSQLMLERVQLERDELLSQIQHLKSEMAEKDWIMKELEQRFHETLSDEERSNCLEREQILKQLRLKTDISPTFSLLLENKEQDIKSVRSEEEEEILLLKKRIDELQQRIEELLNHNQKWKELCEELQQELDKVKGQLLQYQKAEFPDGTVLLANLAHQTKEKERTVELSAKKRIEELESKVNELEKQLAEKELEKEKGRLENKEKIEMYQEQMRVFKEDFENEAREHSMTKNQLDSVKTQWQMIYKELQEKNEQLSRITPQMQVIQDENRKLKEELDQAHRDQILIRDHQLRARDPISSTESTPLLSELRTGQFSESGQWDCPSCTFLNSQSVSVCEMCGTSRLKQSVPSTFTPYSMSGRGAQPHLAQGRLEEDGVACY